MTSSSAVFSRTRSYVFLCASLLGSSSTSQLCRAAEVSLPPCHDPSSSGLSGDSSSSPPLSFASSSWFSCSCTSWYCSGICYIIGCRRPRLLWGHDDGLEVLPRPAVFCESSYTSRIYNSIVRSDKVFVCEVALSQPHTRCPSVCQLRCVISKSLSNLWKMCKNCFAKLHQFSSILWRLHITNSETRNEPSCMSNNPHHQSAVGGWSATCALSGIAANIVFLIGFDSSVAFDVTVWENFE